MLIPSCKFLDLLALEIMFINCHLNVLKIDSKNIFFYVFVKTKEYAIFKRFKKQMLTLD